MNTRFAPAGIRKYLGHRVGCADRFVGKLRVRFARVAAVVCVALTCLPLVVALAGPAGDPAAQAGGKTKPADKRSLSEINKIWMRELHGSGGTAPEKKPGQDSTQPGKVGKSSDPKDSDADPDSSVGQPSGKREQDSDPLTKSEPLRLNNPGTRGSEPAAGQPSRIFDQSDQQTSFVSVAFRFVGILVLMLGGFYLFVRYVRGKGGVTGGGSDLVQVIASVPLIQGRFLQVVDMAGRLLVLGVSEHSVTLLSEVEDARTADRIRLWQSQNRSMPDAARGALGRMTELLRGTEFRFWGGGVDKGPEKASSPGFRELLHGQGGAVPRSAEGSAGAPGSNDVRSASSAAGDHDLFDFAIPPEHDETEPARDEAELRELLKAQKKKLQALKPPR